MYSRGIPVVSADIVIRGATYHYAVGDDITGLVMRAVTDGDHEPVVLTGTVAGIELISAVVNDNPDHKVLDNIPMRGWKNPVCGYVGPVDTDYMVNAILVAVEDGDTTNYHRVTMDQIIAITSYTDATTSATNAYVEADALTGVLDLASALTAATVDGSAILLGPGVVDTAATVTAGVSLLGVKAGEKFTTYDRMMAEPTTVISEKITINASGKDVVIDGCFFTGSALIEITAAQTLTLRNCRFSDLVPAAVDSIIIAGSGSAACKVIVEDCVFGDNKIVENESDVYSFLYVYDGDLPLADGSSFSKNYFAKFACKGSPLHLTAVDANAVIGINENYSEYSDTMIQLSLKGSPTCEVNVNRNAARTVAIGRPGLVRIQPSTTETTSFNGMTVNMNDNQQGGFSDDLVHLYAEATDTQFNLETNYPVVYVDGELQTDIRTVGDTVVESQTTSPDGP